MSSRFLFDVFLFLIVSSASLNNCAQKLLILIASVIYGCILSIVGSRSSKCLKASILTSKINVIVDNGFSIMISIKKWQEGKTSKEENAEQS